MNNNFEINDWVKITMKNKSVICGQIAAFGKKLVEGEEHDFYQVRVLDDRETTVFDVQMQAIEKMYTNVELQDWVNWSLKLQINTELMWKRNQILIIN